MKKSICLAVLLAAVCLRVQAQDHGRPPVSSPPGVEAPRLTVAAPLPEPLAGGLAVIPYRVEGIKILPVFGQSGLSLIPKVGHLHIKLDGASWHWVDTSGEPIVIQGLQPGPHSVRIDLADPTHTVLATQTSTFVVPSR